MIKLYIILLSAALSFTTVYFSFDYSLLTTIFLYLGFVFAYIIGFVLLFFILWGLLVFTVNKNKPHSYSRYYRFVMQLLNIVGLSLFNIKVKYSGKEIVDNLHTNFLLICNHQSNLDSVVADYYLQNHKLIFIGKKSLFKIPFVGKTISGIGYLPLDRNDLRQEAKIVKDATKILSTNDVSVGIYPEGTRNQKKDAIISELKAGSFHLALDSKKPIVISLITYDKDITSNIFKIRHCKYKIVKAITYDEYKNYSSKELAIYIHDIMQEEMNKLYEQKN